MLLDREPRLLDICIRESHECLSNNSRYLPNLSLAFSYYCKAYVGRSRGCPRALGLPWPSADCIPMPPPPAPTLCAAVRGSGGWTRDPCLDTAVRARNPQYDTHRLHVTETWGPAT